LAAIICLIPSPMVEALSFRLNKLSDLGLRVKEKFLYELTATISRPDGIFGMDRESLV